MLCKSALSHLECFVEFGRSFDNLDLLSSDIKARGHAIQFAHERGK